MKKIGVLLFLLQFMVTSLSARQIADVMLEEEISVSGVEIPLALNGAGIRKKLFFKIYVAALYLPKALRHPEEIIDDPGPKRVVMYFLYSEVEREKLVDAWNDGFSANHSDSEMKLLEKRLKRFNGLFGTMRKGDVVLLDYIPDNGTRVTINGEKKGEIPGADFNQALLRVWLGASPVTTALKQALLGG